MGSNRGSTPFNSQLFLWEVPACAGLEERGYLALHCNMHGIHDG